jgi:hypothetical protein
VLSTEKSLRKFLQMCFERIFPRLYHTYRLPFAASAKINAPMDHKQTIGIVDNFCSDTYLLPEVWYFQGTCLSS